MASPSSASDNFFRLAKFLARLSPRVLRALFKQHALSGTEKSIDEFLNNHQGSIWRLQRSKILHQTQIDLVFPASGQTNIEEWDLTLLTCLLQNLFKFSSQQLLYLNTLRTAKNEINSHTSGAEIDDVQFNNFWNDIESATMNLAALINDKDVSKVMQSDIANTKTGPLTVGDRTSVDILRMWAERDRQLGVLVDHTTGQSQASDRIERLSACLVDGGAYALRPVLQNYIHKNGFASISAFLKHFENSIRKNLSAKLNIVFPDDGSPTDESRWDVSIYFTILFRICNISGSIDSHLRDIRLQRDNLYSEREKQTFTDASFDRYFDNIQTSLKAVLPDQASSHVTALEDRLESLRTGIVLLNDASTRLVDWYNFDQQKTRYDDEQVLRERQHVAEWSKTDFKTDKASSLQINLVISGDTDEDESCVYGCMQSLKTGWRRLTGHLAAFGDALCQNENRIIGVDRSSVVIAIECSCPEGLLHVWHIYDSGQLADLFDAVLRELRVKTGRELALQITCSAADILHTLHMNESIGNEGRHKDAAEPLLIETAPQPEACSFHQEPLMFYCKSHEEMVCSMCLLDQHHACGVDTKRTASEEIQATYEIKLVELKRERDRLCQSKIEANRHIQKLKFDKETALKSAENYRAKIMEAIHREEDTVKKTYSSETEKLNKIKDLCGTEIDSLNMAETELNNAKVKGTVRALSAALKKFSEQIVKSTEYVPAFVDVQQIQTRLDKLRENIVDTIKMATTETVHSSIRPKKNIELKDKTLAKVDTYNVREPDDENECCISGCQFLPSGRLVMCDTLNGKLKLLDTGTGVLESIELDDKPLDIAVVSATEVVVLFTFSDHLQFVTLEPELKVARTLRVVTWRGGMAYHDQKLYVSHMDSAGRNSILIMSLDGEELNRLHLTNCILTERQYLTVDRYGRVYLSGMSEDAIFCMEQNADPVFMYQDADLRAPAGLLVDRSQNVYVCGRDSRNVQAVTAEGAKAKTILTASHGLQCPMSIAYREGDQTLAVGQDADDVILFRPDSST